MTAGKKLVYNIPEPVVPDGDRVTLSINFGGSEAFSTYSYWKFTMNPSVMSSTRTYLVVFTLTDNNKYPSTTSESFTVTVVPAEYT